MYEQLIKRLSFLATAEDATGMTDSALAMREAAAALGQATPPAAVAVPEGYRLQPHSEFDAMNAFIRGEIKVPPGYALVPVEPTTAILRPFYECPVDELPLAWSAALAIAKAQNKAAPAPAAVATEAVAQGGEVNVEKVMAMLKTYHRKMRFAESANDLAMMRAREWAAQEWAEKSIRALLASAPAVAVPDALRAFADEVKQLCKDFSDRWDRPYMGDVTAAIDGLYEQFAAAPASPAATGWVPGEVLRRVDSIILDCDTSEGQQTGGYLGVGDLRKIKEAIVAMPAQAGGATPYTGRDQELIDRLWNPPAPSVDGEG